MRRYMDADSGFSYVRDVEILERDDGARAEDDAPTRDDAPLPDGDAIIFAFRRNVVVAASAGTGKTHRLTALYVLLALGLTSMGAPDDRSAAEPVTPDRIVATTFSRAAAREI